MELANYLAVKDNVCALRTLAKDPEHPDHVVLSHWFTILNSESGVVQNITYDIAEQYFRAWTSAHKLPKQSQTTAARRKRKQREAAKKAKPPRKPDFGTYP